MSNVDQLINPTPLPFLLTMAFYFAVLIVIGYIASRNTKNLKDFLVMGGKAGAIVSGMAYFSTQYSMSTFMGVPAIAYANGFAGMSISVPGVAFSMLIPALIVGRRLMLLGRHNDFLTMTDYLADRYQSTVVRALHAIMIVVFLIAMMGAQNVGAGVIVKTYTGLPEWTGVTAMGLIVIFYCMVGGMRGAMLTDVLQGTLMVCTAVATFYFSMKAGGGLSTISAKLASLNEGYLAHPGVKGEYPWGVYITMIMMWSFFTIGQPTLFTKFFTMKNYQSLFKGVLLGSLGMLISATMIEWSGVSAIVSIPGLTGKDTDYVVPLILQKNLDPVLASILIAGIVSAGLSTISALLVVATGGITRDIYQRLINPNASDDHIFRLSRWVTLGVGIAGVAIGIYKPSGIFELVRFAFGGMGIWVAAVVLGMYWRRTTTAGVVTGVLLGELYFIALKAKWIAASWAFGMDPLLPAWILAMAVTVAVSLVTRPVAEPVLARHFEGFYTK